MLVKQLNRQQCASDRTFKGTPKKTEDINRFRHWGSPALESKSFCSVWAQESEIDSQLATKQSPCKAAPSEASTQPERRPPVHWGSKLERGGAGRETLTRSGGAGWCLQQDELWIRWQWFVEAAENGWYLQQYDLWRRWKWFVEAAENLASWWQQDDLWKGWKMKCGGCGNLATLGPGNRPNQPRGKGGEGGRTSGHPSARVEQRR